MHANWFNALKTLFVLFFIFLINAKHLAYADDVSSEETESLLEDPLVPNAKASEAFRRVQGGWGKRNLIKELPMQYLGSIDYSESMRNPDYEPSRFRSSNLIPDSDDYDGGSQTVQKRAWTSMNGAWGKRDWNKFRNTGKREPGNWNNLRGLWGKRSNDLRSWNKLSSAWGK